MDEIRDFILISANGQFMCSLLVNCSPTSIDTLPTVYPTPNIPNWGSTSTVPNHSLLNKISCEMIPTTEPSLGTISWRGLTIGISRVKNVIDTLANDKNSNYHWNTIVGNLQFLIPFDSSFKLPTSALATDWGSAETCFLNDKLTAINILGTIEFQKPLKEFVAKYGEPDKVTWGEFYEYRSVIWAEKGLMIVVDFSQSDQQVYQALLFSPILRCELEQSWIFENLPKEGKKFTGDVAMNVPEVEDPTGMEKGLRDCSK